MDNSQENETITIICNQTSYTQEEAKEKLLLFNNDYISVIKDFLNIPIEKKKNIESLNQEIYKQIRLKLNESIDIINKINYEKLNEDNF
jgi:hypothetical protein